MAKKKHPDKYLDKVSVKELKALDKVIKGEKSFDEVVTQKLLDNPDILHLINQSMEKSGLTVDILTQTLIDILRQEPTESSVGGRKFTNQTALNSNKTQIVNMLYKMMGLFTEKTEVGITEFSKLSDKDIDKQIESYQRFIDNGGKDVISRN